MSMPQLLLRSCLGSVKAVSRQEPRLVGVLWLPRRRNAAARFLELWWMEEKTSSFVL